jgi:UDP-N-acetylmuramoyl-L-alanyl-D-glutamate--2,6-diaminopimelate ligase
MKLNKLLGGLEKYKISGSTNVSISSISDDSRKAKRGSLFIAIAGRTTDGHQYIDVALKKGSVAVIGERTPRKEWLNRAVYVKVANSRKALALVASAWYGHPSKKLKVIGVTGTDGKTTTASMIYHLLRTAGRKAGLVTSVSVNTGNRIYDSGLHVTNPEPLILHRIFFEMVKARCEFAVLEVTSHGIDQYRISGIDFELAVLTNITHEHLDYHGTFKEYKKTKYKFLRSARRFIKTSQIDPLTKGIKEEYNRKNMSLAIDAVRIFGISDSEVKKAIKTFSGVTGRLEEVKNDRDIKIYIDFAHTPNSLENVLRELKRDCEGKLISVFGCAGERDKAKRVKMGEISGKLADISVFTAEDPRSEKAENIINQMIKGAKRIGVKNLKDCKHELKGIKQRGGGSFFMRIPERGEAIAYTIQKIAEEGDTIVICGKGHEKSMVYNGVEYPWSDHEAVRIALKGGVKKIKKK